VSGTTSVLSIDPQSISTVWKPEVKKGPQDALDNLGSRDVILVDGWANSHGFDVGDRLTVRTPLEKQILLTVRGTVDNRGDFFNDLTVTNAVIQSEFGQTRDGVDLVKVAPGASLAAVQAGVDKVLKAQFPVVESQNRKQFKDDIANQVNQLLALVYALLSLSIIVSLFGIVNTLVLSIHERTRELGMMRAIGTSRRQVRRIVRYESVITALIGAGLGLAIGLFLGFMTTKALSDQGLTFSVPVVSLLVFVVLAVVAGVLAAIPPARRASRLDVLESLAYE
jgi:putative ABC transport system permease protein